jgi:hypothetical protein
MWATNSILWYFWHISSAFIIEVLIIIISFQVSGDMSVMPIWSETTKINTKKQKDLNVQRSGRSTHPASLWMWYEIWWSTMKYNMSEVSNMQCEVVWGHTNASGLNMNQNKVWLRLRFQIQEQRCSLSWNTVAMIQTQCWMWGKLPSSLFDK